MKRLKGWVCGLLTGEREYKLNGVTYIVSASFEDPNSDNTIRSRFENVITNEMIDLIDKPPDDIITEEYVYSAVGKED